MKVCIKCGKERPVDAFCRDKCRKDGRHPYCTPCKSGPYAVGSEKRQKRRAAIMARTSKRCAGCGQRKLLEMFYANSSCLDGRTSRCAECLKKQKREQYDPKKAKAYYQRTRKERLKSSKLIRDTNKLNAISMLGGACSHCGIEPGKEWPLACFDFHHKAKNKENSIAKMLRASDKTLLLKEVRKCVLLCATCHRRHHALEANPLI